MFLLLTACRSKQRDSNSLVFLKRIANIVPTLSRSYSFLETAELAEGQRRRKCAGSVFSAFLKTAELQLHFLR